MLGVGRVMLGGVTRAPLPFQRAIRDLAEDAVRRQVGPRYPCDLNNPRD